MVVSIVWSLDRVAKISERNMDHIVNAGRKTCLIVELVILVMVVGTIENRIGRRGVGD
jgi:hypothetical protein